MSQSIRHTPRDARDLTVLVTGKDGVRRPRTALKHNATHLFVHSRRDNQEVAIHKADILPPGMWDLCAFIRAAAEAEGISPAELVNRLRHEMPEQLQAAIDLAASPKAPSGPDLRENGSHAAHSRACGNAA